MKNLKLSKELPLKLEMQSEGETLLFSAFDVERNRMFFASSTNVLYALPLTPSPGEKPWSRDLLLSQGESLTFEPGDSITALDYLMEKEAVIVGTSNGYLILHIVDCNTTEVVGRVEGGIKDITPSPDGALIAVIAGLGQLLVMTHDWEVLYEVSLDPQLLNDESTGDMNGSSGYQFKSSISWRGDGKYFATLSGPCEPYLQKLQIWERDSGTLHATAESDAFIGECLAWMPSGAKVVAAYDRKAQRKCPSIIFFEKNGLERSSFSIEESPETVVEALTWNCSSDLLAACVTLDGYDAIKIWSFSNNHWYLKQEIRYQKMDSVKFDWNPTKPLQLICWTADGKLTIFNFILVTAVMENSNAFVIDGSIILVSPLDVSIIPPPMSLFKLKFPAAVQEIAYLCKNSKNYLAACLSSGSLCVVELPASDTWELFEDLDIIVETSHSDLTFRDMRHLTWLDSHMLVGVSCCDNSQFHSCLAPSFRKSENSNQGTVDWSYCLQEIELECSNCIPEPITSSGWHVKDSKKLLMEKPVVGIVPNPTKRCSAFVQLDGGCVLEYSSNLNFSGSPAEFHPPNLSSDFDFLSSCPWMKTVLVSDNDVMKPLVFGLDDTGRLQIGKRIFSNNCSSFSFYSDTAGVMQKVITHLIFTTKQDLLFVVPMDDILHGNPEVDIERSTGSGIQTRKAENKDFIIVWERGAKLVGVIHGDEAAVILQAVRGNLECMYPRKLVIVAIANALAQWHFRDAMLLVRRHRINFNVIVDYCGLQAFLKLAGEFVSQVSNLGHITEFVCAIKNENVMDTLYKTTLPMSFSKVPVALNCVDPDGFGSTNKVSSVLLAVRMALEELVPESPLRELCILTTLARSEPPALEEALRRIKVIRELELLEADDARRKSYPSAEEALKHLLWLTNTEAVYDAALGLYDLNLAAIVALNSDKDPKEFLPFLRELEHLLPVIMQYTIDLRLHRYESALRNIVSAGDAYFGDCMKLMENNPTLFPLGLQLFTDHVKRRQVLEAWGDHLHAEKCFEDAVTPYLCCSSFHKALKAYRACGDWRGVLTVAGLLKLTKEEFLQLATDLCDELQALGKPAEAAKVALEYCADVSSGVGYYVTAREWQEALRIAYLHAREDLVTEVRNAATECASTLICEYEEGLEKVGKYVARYIAVRQRRLVLAAKLQLEERPMDDIDDDTVSEASSNFSGMSAYTMGSVKGSNASVRSSTTSKSRQMRRERKGGKIRAGSPGEELALLEHLKGMCLTTSAQRELKSLLLALVMLGKEETARQLQHVADNFHLTQVAAVKLAEDASSSEKIDESTYTLQNYLKKLRQNPNPETLSWQSAVLLSR